MHLAGGTMDDEELDELDEMAGMESRALPAKVVELEGRQDKATRVSTRTSTCGGFSGICISSISGLNAAICRGLVPPPASSFSSMLVSPAPPPTIKSAS